MNALAPSESAQSHAELHAAPLFVRPKDVARILSVSTFKVQTLLASGELRSIKLGKTRLIPVAALREIEARAMGES